MLYTQPERFDADVMVKEMSRRPMHCSPHEITFTRIEGRRGCSVVRFTSSASYNHGESLAGEVIFWRWDDGRWRVVIPGSREGMNTNPKELVRYGQFLTSLSEYTPTADDQDTVLMATEQIAGKLQQGNWTSVALDISRFRYMYDEDTSWFGEGFARQFTAMLSARMLPQACTLGKAERPRLRSSAIHEYGPPVPTSASEMIAAPLNSFPGLESMVPIKLADGTSESLRFLWVRELGQWKLWDVSLN
jgi:hypothetical protein